MRAIHELKSIAYFTPPDIKQQIDSWITKYIGEASCCVRVSRFGDLAHLKHQEEQAKRLLGTTLAERSAMWNAWGTNTITGERQLVVQTLYIKNETVQVDIGHIEGEK